MSLLSTTSYATESSLTPSLIESESDFEFLEVDELPIEMPSPSTEPSLLSTIQLSPVSLSSTNFMFVSFF